MDNVSTKYKQFRVDRTRVTEQLLCCCVPVSCKHVFVVTSTIDVLVRMHQNYLKLCEFYLATLWRSAWSQNGT